MDNEVTEHEVQRDYPQVTDFLNYLHYLAITETDASVGQLWAFYREAVRRGRYPSEVAEELGLPVLDAWL